MPVKIFTTIAGPCPYGKSAQIDSSACHVCEHFYRTGTAMFFWCRHPSAQNPAEIAQKAPKIAREKPKRGRKPGMAAKKPVKALKRNR